MTRYTRLIERALDGEPILIDGGTGSETFRRGVPESEFGWSGAAALTHPDVVRAIHTDYLEIGADLIASCTFATGKNILEDVGRPEDFEPVNRRAVELAVEARDAMGSDAVVAAGISNWSFSGNRPSLHKLHDDTVEQARIMAAAGADLISLEMMVDIPRMTATLNAVTHTDLPVWVGLSIGPDEGHDADLLPDPIPLREADLLVDAVQIAAGFPEVEAICLMHTDTRLMEKGLRAIRPVWNGPLGAYAHASMVVDGHLEHNGVISPEAYAAYVPVWQAAGATMIGGCCGIGPDHLRLVADALR